MQHKRFDKCKENNDQIRGHKPLMLAFIGLFMVTCYSVIKNDVFGICLENYLVLIYQIIGMLFGLNLNLLVFLFGLGKDIVFL